MLKLQGRVLLLAEMPADGLAEQTQERLCSAHAGCIACVLSSCIAYRTHACVGGYSTYIPREEYNSAVEGVKQHLICWLSRKVNSKEWNVPKSAYPLIVEIDCAFYPPKVAQPYAREERGPANISAAWAKRVWQAYMEQRRGVFDDLVFVIWTMPSGSGRSEEMAFDYLPLSYCKQATLNWERSDREGREYDVC